MCSLSKRLKTDLKVEKIYLIADAIWRKIWCRIILWCFDSLKWRREKKTCPCFKSQTMVGKFYFYGLLSFECWIICGSKKNVHVSNFKTSFTFKNIKSSFFSSQRRFPTFGFKTWKLNDWQSIKYTAYWLWTIDSLKVTIK